MYGRSFPMTTSGCARRQVATRRCLCLPTYTHIFVLIVVNVSFIMFGNSPVTIDHELQEQLLIFRGNGGQENYRLCSTNPFLDALKNSAKVVSKRMTHWLNDDRSLPGSMSMDRKYHDHTPDRFFPFVEMASCDEGHLECVGGECRGGDDFQQICGLESLKQQPNCIVYSIGASKQLSFEEDMLKRTPCEIHTFDCTGPTEVCNVPKHPRLHFHRVCITAHSPKGARQFEEQWVGESLTLLEMQQRLGHSRIDLLRMDLGGWEFPILHSWPELDQENDSQKSSMPMQIMVKINYNITFDGKHRDPQKSLTDLANPIEIVKLQTHLLRMGYAVTVRHDSPSCAHCTHLTLMKVHCASHKSDSWDDGAGETSLPVWDVETRQKVLEESRSKSVGSIESSSTRIQSVRLGNSEIFGTIQDGGRLVVYSHSDVKWVGGREGKLCQLLRDMTLKTSLDDNLTNDAVSLLPPPLLIYTRDCECTLGRQGKGLVGLYLLRIAAAKAKVDFQFQCSTGRKSLHKSIFAWLSGYFPTASSSGNGTPSNWPYGGGDGDSGTPPTEKEVCPNGLEELRLGKFCLVIQEEMRRLAVGLVGPRTTEQEAYVLNGQSSSAPPLPPLPPLPPSPFYPNLTLDDVVIHFRCGDIFGGTVGWEYGVWHFGEYVKWIRSSPPPRSIGILTQPFEKDRNRDEDISTVDNCRQATHTLVDYLKLHYANADVRIHNGVNETLPLAYARLVMAKQSFSTASTFGIFPIIGTFGDGYFQKGQINAIASPVARILPNIHEIEGLFLVSKLIGELGLPTVLKWLVADVSGRKTAPDKKYHVYYVLQWYDLPKNVQDALGTLGYNQQMWDTHGLPNSYSKYWSALTADERIAAQELGYLDAEDWDND